MGFLLQAEQLHLSGHIKQGDMVRLNAFHRDKEVSHLKYQLYLKHALYLIQVNYIKNKDHSKSEGSS